jgi:hypothetical protein
MQPLDNYMERIAYRISPKSRQSAHISSGCILLAQKLIEHKRISQRDGFLIIYRMAGSKCKGYLKGHTSLLEELSDKISKCVKSKGTIDHAN